MAKTRMKTTPTRMQKDALMSATSVTEDVKKRHRHPMATTTITTAKAQSKEQLHAISTIIVPAPKRTNSISSATSSISHASDTPSSLHSDNDSPPPPLPKTLNSLLCKPAVTTKAASVVVATPHQNIATLKNRKVYMITEKCEDSTNTDSGGGAGGGNNAATSQKRKMYLIMEENNDAQVDDDASDASVRKYIKTENGHCIATAAASKKLTLYADKSDGGLTQKFEKILPEILNRIQSAKNAAIVTTANAAHQQHYHNDDDDNIKIKLKSEIDQEPITTTTTTIERLPITLPPKKNRTKIITHAAATMNYHNSSNNSNSNGNNGTGIYTINHKGTLVKPLQQQQISAATPVIVSAASLIPKNKNIINCNNSNNSASKCNGQTATLTATTTSLTPQLTQPAQKNINLSTDFLFLMKMLPKLESIPEPHKNHVKSCIEKIIAQNANLFEKQKQ